VLCVLVRFVQKGHTPHMAPWARFGHLTAIDKGLLLLVGLVLAGVLAVQAGWHRSSSQAILGETAVEFTVITTNTRTKDPTMLKAGDTTHLTVRNQPRGNVAIVDVAHKPHQLVVTTAAGEVRLVDDPSLAYSVDYEITLSDHAVITADGYVANGVKLKVGLPIELEGPNYRIPAAIVAVTPVSPHG
jgi:hypothetical protein